MTTFNRNRHSPAQFGSLTRQDLQEEIADIIQQEMQDLRAGREENALMIHALSNQWSPEQIINVALRRGKTWRFLAALSDKALQAQGIALLTGLIEAYGMDLNEHVLRKSFAVIDRIDDFYAESIRRHGENSRKAEILEEMQDGIVDATKQARHAYYELAGRLILSSIEETR